VTDSGMDVDVADGASGAGIGLTASRLVVGDAQLGGVQESSEAHPSGAVAGIEDAAQVAAGGKHSCARARTGEIWCSRRNQLGQLGNGTTKSTATPQRVVW